MDAIRTPGNGSSSGNSGATADESLFGSLGIGTDHMSGKAKGLGSDA